MKKWVFFAILLVLAVSACGPAPTTASPAGEAATPPATSNPFLDQLKNRSYELQASDTPRTVTLVDGKFTSAGVSGPDFVNASLLDKVGFGDLDGDGQPDAAVLLAEDYGGSGTFVSLLAMLDRNGQPEQVGSEFIDDRPQINSLTAQHGVITLDVVVHGPDDPMCCPTQRQVMTFAVAEQGMTVWAITGFTPGGDERSITIDSPAEGAEVSGSVQLTGRFTISPFENTLRYEILDATGAELLAGPMTVTAPELGGPGTFETTVDISSIPAGTPIQISVQDISAADGSILAMDSVSATTK